MAADKARTNRADQWLHNWLGAELPKKREMLAAQNDNTLEEDVFAALTAAVNANNQSPVLKLHALILNLSAQGHAGTAFDALEDPERFEEFFVQLVQEDEIVALVNLALLAALTAVDTAFRAEALFHAGLGIAIDSDVESGLEYLTAALKLAPDRAQEWRTGLIHLAPTYPQISPLSAAFSADA